MGQYGSKGEIYPMSYIKLSAGINDTVITLDKDITVIYGQSGVGKTEILELQRNSIKAKKAVYSIESDLKFRVILDSDSSEAYSDALRDHTCQLLIMDEGLARKRIQFPNSCSIPVVVVCRNKALLNYVDIRCLRTLVIEDSRRITSSELFVSRELVGVPDYVLVESSEHHNEHLYLSRCMPEIKNVIACDGRNNTIVNLGKIYRRTGCRKFFIAIDLCAGASIMPGLLFYQRRYNLDISFIEYTSFEAILYFSKLVRCVGRVYNTDSPYKSLEDFYEDALRFATVNTPLHSEHPHISDCFVRDCNGCCEHSQSSLLLKTLFNKEGLTLLKWYWSTYHPEWVQLTDSIIKALQEKYNPDGF